MWHCRYNPSISKSRFKQYCSACPRVDLSPRVLQLGAQSPLVIRDTGHILSLVRYSGSQRVSVVRFLVVTYNCSFFLTKKKYPRALGVVLNGLKTYKCVTFIVDARISLSGGLFLCFLLCLICNRRLICIFSKLSIAFKTWLYLFPYKDAQYYHISQTF